MPLGDINQYDCCKAQQQLPTVLLMSSVRGIAMEKRKIPFFPTQVLGTKFELSLLKMKWNVMF